MINKKNIYALVALATLTTLATAIPVFAADTTTNSTSQLNKADWTGKMRAGKEGNKGMMKPAVFGTVSAVSGNTLTVASKQGVGANVVSTTFTVDATNAKVMKNNVAGTVASILVGDTVVVQGTVSGTNVVATNIRDGVMMREGEGNKTEKGDKVKQILPAFTGNGQPVVAGTVSAINGAILTITNKSNVTYTIDTANAKIMKDQNTILVSNIAVNDNVIVQGTVNGNAVVASTVIDQAQQTTNTSGTGEQPHKGFFSNVGLFFAHLFGY